MDSIKLFCPATIANLSCGFDVLGLCLESVGDEMLITKTSEKGLKISRVTGQELPLSVEKNVAGVAATALLESLDYEPDFGFDICIHKHIKPGSGIGSSAASAAGAVYGINKLLGMPYTLSQLIPFAMEGEQLASGSLHADNVAPAILGGITLVRSYDPLDIINLNTPKALFVSVVHPQIEIKTADARVVLKKNIPLNKAIRQWGNVGAFVSGLYTEDYPLISRALEDVIIEPVRGMLIPKFNQVKEAAVKAGALGSGISGSGPSIFALSKGKQTAVEVGHVMKNVYQQIQLDVDVHVSPINNKGLKVIS